MNFFNMTKKLLAVSILASLGFLFGYVLSDFISTVENTPNIEKYNAIVKIVSEQGGSCSATVYSDTEAITAAHCVGITKKDLFYIKREISILKKLLKTTDNPFILIKIAKTIKYLETLLARGPSIHFIISDKGVRTGVVALAKETYGRRDIAILEGNFKNFKKLKLKTKEIGLENNKSYTTCGYVAGNIPPVCIPFVPVRPYVFSYAGECQILPGMSGGPVLNRHNEIVGINSRVNVPENIHNAHCLVEPTLGIH